MEGEESCFGGVRKLDRDLSMLELMLLVLSFIGQAWAAVFEALHYLRCSQRPHYCVYNACKFMWCFLRLVQAPCVLFLGILGAVQSVEYIPVYTIAHCRWLPSSPSMAGLGQCVAVTFK